MAGRMTTTTFFATAAGLLLAVAPAAAAPAGGDPGCFRKSALAAPAGYAERCGGGAVPPALAPRIDPGFIPGDPVFYCSVFSANPTFDQRLLTAPLPTLNYTDVGPCSVMPAAIFAMDFDNPANVLWAIDSGPCGLGGCSGARFGTINQATGAFTQVGTITGAPAGANFAGLRFDPTTGQAYIIVITPTDSSQFFSLSLATGVATPIGAPIPAIVIDIAISNAGVVYGHDISANRIITIDKATGAVAAVGATGINANFAQGMDFDPSDDTLYLFAFTIPDNVGRVGRVNVATGAFTQLSQGLEELEGAIKVPVGAAVSVAPVGIAVDSAGNGVYQRNEIVNLEPTWRNTGQSAIALTGELSNHTGPPGATYSILDGDASYGTILVSGQASCTSTGDCYTVGNAAAAHPVTHWDSTVDETMTPTSTTKTWVLHIGDSFTDVPDTSPFFRFIETILHKNVTGGCTPTTYCPTASTSREQMAVFVLVSREAPGYAPPNCVAGAEEFADVPASSPFCRWIEELARRGVVSGCGNGNYCPAAPASREQMAVFVLRTLDPTFNPPSCITGSEMFADVPASSPFCKWIEELARRGVVTGCGGGNYCPAADVSREEMAVFLAATFGLTLYGL
jgi:hypothetical protein